MLMKLFDSVSVASGASETSILMSMAGANCIQIHAIGENLGTATTFTVAAEGTLDHNNWSTIVSWTLLGAGNNFPAKQTGIGFAAIRLKLTPVGGGPVIATVYANSSAQ